VEGVGPEEVRQFVGGVGDSERRPVGLERQAGFERPGIDCVESESIDEPGYRDDCGGVVARRSDRDNHA
jgi:hypothetical protein